jgi:hypothetical protein
MMYLMHLNYFYEFGSIEPNSKKHRNIEKIRFGFFKETVKIINCFFILFAYIDIDINFNLIIAINFNEILQ